MFSLHFPPDCRGEVHLGCWVVCHREHPFSWSSSLGILGRLGEEALLKEGLCLLLWDTLDANTWDYSELTSQPWASLITWALWILDPNLCEVRSVASNSPKHWLSHHQELRAIQSNSHVPLMASGFPPLPEDPDFCDTWFHFWLPVFEVTPPIPHSAGETHFCCIFFLGELVEWAPHFRFRSFPFSPFPEFPSFILMLVIYPKFNGDF